MGVYGPFNASLNKVVQVTGIDPNADRVFIENQSKYTLAIGFTPTQPTAVPTLYGQPWYGEVPPGGKTVHIPPAAYNEPFPGYFWVLALDPLSATRAYTGTPSSNTVFFVQSLVKGEPSPPDYAIPQSTDLSSQPRVVSVPTAQQVNNNNWFNASPTIPTTGNSVNLTTLQLPITPQPGGIAMLYLYSLAITLLPTGAAGAGSLDAGIMFDAQTAANASIATLGYPQQMMRWMLSWAAAAGPFPVVVWTPGHAIALAAVLPGGLSIDHFALVLHSYGSTNVPTFMTVMGAFATDLTNANNNNLIFTPGGIGNPGFGGGNPLF